MFDNPVPCSSNLRTAAVAGDAEAQFALALSLACASSSPDYAQAVEWYQKAADQDHALAQFNLSQMFAQGQGVPRNDSVAVMWIRRAAQRGDAGAQFKLGERYERSSVQGSEMDAAESRIEAYKWFALAAEQNYRDAEKRADSATMRMSRDEVSDGLRRVKSFAAR